jgi:hypothetical protein
VDRNVTDQVENPNGLKREVSSLQWASQGSWSAPLPRTDFGPDHSASEFRSPPSLTPRPTFSVGWIPTTVLRIIFN